MRCEAALQECAVRVLELRVNSEALITLPAWLGELASLKLLILSGCKGLTALPVELKALTVLDYLDLSGCTGLTALLSACGARASSLVML